MARSPRGGFRSSDVRGTLGSLLKSTLAQAGVVRDVLERGAREGRARLDDARAGRRRHEALAELGEVVLELIRRGEIDLAELPEVREVVADLDELDAAGGGPRRGREAWGRGGGGVRDEDELPPWDDDEVALPSSRARFDARGGGGGGGVSDGTVSSSRWTPPSGRTATPGQRVWRPPASAAEAPAPTGEAHGALSDRVSLPSAPTLPKPIARAQQKTGGGGIRFDDDDDDLADYMHPDDVPPKPPRQD